MMQAVEPLVTAYLPSVDNQIEMTRRGSERPRVDNPSGDE
jgi:hypothetical protein